MHKCNCRCAAPVTTTPLESLRHLIGGTKLLVITCRVRGREIPVYAKYEALNFTGSIKDRMALHIMEVAYADGRIQPGDEIAEATSGNTGISFAAVGRALGHPVRIYMPDRTALISSQVSGRSAHSSVHTSRSAWWRSQFGRFAHF